MRSFVIALALAGLASTGPALAKDIHIDYDANTCSNNYSIEEQTTDKFTGACNGRGVDVKISYKSAAGHVTCEPGTRSNVCSCTNSTEMRGSAAVSVGC